jgi:exosortase A
MANPTAEAPSPTLLPGRVDEPLESARQPARPRANAWPVALSALTATLATLVWLFWDTGRSMVLIWYSLETYAHGFVIVPITVYMAWTRRAELARLTPQPSWGALLVLAGAALLWLLAELVGVQAVRHFAFVAMVPLAVWTVLGTRVAWALAFPLVYLFFAVPTGEFLTEPLMDYTARATVWAIQMTGIPVYSEGRFITIPSGNWEVAEACSGVRYLIASVALGSLYAYLTYRSLWRRALFIALSIAVPIVANWVRAYGIVMLGHLSDMRLAVGVDHIIYGWVFFGFVMLLMFWIGSFWQEDTDERSQGARAMAAAQLPASPGGLHALPQVNRPASAVAASASALFFVLAGLTVALVAATGPLAAREIAAREASAGGVEVVLPATTASWAGPMAPTEAWAPTFPGSAQRLHQSYQREGSAVQAYAVLYLRERQGEELIAWGNRLLDPGVWKPLASPRYTSTRLGPNSEMSVQETDYTSGRSRRLVWQWYDIAGHRTASPEVAKLLGAWARLTGDRNGYALVALAADYNGRPEDARALLTDLLASTPALTSPLRREFTAEAQRR